jgi:LPXTG-site transpeptidase (sortase) family protein
VSEDNFLNPTDDPADNNQPVSDDFSDNWFESEFVQNDSTYLANSYQESAELPPDVSLSSDDPLASADFNQALRKAKKKQVKITPSVVISDILFTLAFIILLYLIWQLWWTGFTARQAQDQALGTVQWDQPVDPDKPAVPLDYAPCDISNTAKWQELWGDNWKTTYDQNWKQPEEIRDMIGRVYIPRFGKDYTHNMVQGTDKLKVLDLQGFGHYVDTAMPGCVGNFAAAAHRDGYGEPLGPVETLVQDDALVVRTQHYWYVYKLTSHEVVDPTQSSVLLPVPNDPGATPVDRLLTFTTCHPRWSMDKRYIVYAKFSYWAEVKSGVPQEMLDVGTKIMS